MADLRNIQDKKTIKTTWYELFFQYKDGDRNSGYGFPCTPGGVIVPDENYKYWRENLEKCQNGTYGNVFPGVVKLMKSYHTEPKHGTCACGEVVLLDPDFLENYCDGCGKIYAYYGTQVLPLSMCDEPIDPEPGVIPGWD